MLDPRRSQPSWAPEKGIRLFPLEVHNRHTGFCASMQWLFIEDAAGARDPGNTPASRRTWIEFISTTGFGEAIRRIMSSLHHATRQAKRRFLSFAPAVGDRAGTCLQGSHRTKGACDWTICILVFLGYGYGIRDHHEGTQWCWDPEGTSWRYV